MDKKLKNKVDALVKSMYKNVKKSNKKDAIEDVLDNDRIAEVAVDDVPTSRGGVVLKKNKKKTKKKSKEKLVGGDADDMSDEEFDSKDLKIGAEVEKEHTSDKQSAKEVARDHLESTDKYYEEDGKAAGKEMSEDVKEAKKKKGKGKLEKDLSQPTSNNQFTRPKGTPNPNANSNTKPSIKGFGSMLGTPPKQGDKQTFDTSKFKFGKGEKFVVDFLDKFETIAKAYLMEKAKIDDFEPSASARRKARGNRGKAQNVRTAKNKVQMKQIDETPINEMKHPRGQIELKANLKDKHKNRNKDKGIENEPSKEDLEYPMVASEKTL